MTSQAQAFFDKELESLRSEVIAAKDTMQGMDSGCKALKEETNQATAAHSAAVKVCLHGSFADLLLLLPLADLLYVLLNNLRFMAACTTRHHSKQLQPHCATAQILGPREPSV